MGRVRVWRVPSVTSLRVALTSPTLGLLVPASVGNVSLGGGGVGRVASHGSPRARPPPAPGFCRPLLPLPGARRRCGAPLRGRGGRAPLTRRRATAPRLCRRGRLTRCCSSG